MAMKKVTSREYKVMLRPSRFTGDERRLLHAADELWGDFSKSVRSVVVERNGRLDTISVRRFITFYDTRDHRLNAARYIVRDRRDVAGDGRDVTLKFRHFDRYITQDREMDATVPEAKTKFEEDIKGPFVSLYSFSTRVMLEDSRPFKRLEDVRQLFPGIVTRIDGFRDDARVSVVGGFKARELVLTGANLRVGKTPKVEAECALIVWYDAEKSTTAPVAVELSYRYGDKDEGYGGGASRRAFDVFSLLQSKLGKWVDPKPRTKTAFVYQ